MINWIILAAVIVGIYFLFHIKHTKHKISLALMIVLILFLYFSVAAIMRSNSLDLTSPAGLVEAGRIYFSWLGQAFGNMKIITGNVIGMDWVPEGQNISDLDPRNIMRG